MAGTRRKPADQDFSGDRAPIVRLVNRIRGTYPDRRPGETFDCVHPHHVMGFHVSGAGRYVSGAEVFDHLRTPTLGVLPAGEDDRNGMTGAFDIRYVMFDAGGVASTADRREVRVRLGDHVVQRSHVRQLDRDGARAVLARFQALTDLRRGEGVAAELRASAIVLELLALWAGPAATGAADEIDAYRSTIAASACDERRSLAELARGLGHDADRLGARFTARHGVTPVAYRLRLRLERARELLAGGASVADAAKAAGFADPAYFARRFRHAYATTPRAFARSVRLGMP
jgi:AraC-like DNA-binding protein